MRRLGTLLHITPRGSLIVRTIKTPPLGGIVLNSRAERIGKIVDVFGPVKMPYVTVRPLKETLKESVSQKSKSYESIQLAPGAVLYVGSRPAKAEKARKKRK